jgi:nudix-type nucleoside diphosphatase (YffH/AdpP family)
MKEKVKIIKEDILSNAWSLLTKYTLQYRRENGKIETQYREVHHTGNGTCVLLYNKENRKIILVRQFRIATLINGHKDGFIYEVPAGLVEESNPEKTIIKEILEETGIAVDDVSFLYAAYSTPGARTERVSFYKANYTDKMKVEKGGGLSSEQEEIEIIELDFDSAYGMISTGEIEDLKTISLLQYAKLYVFN